MPSIRVLTFVAAAAVAAALCASCQPKASSRPAPPAGPTVAAAEAAAKGLLWASRGPASGGHRAARGGADTDVWRLESPLRDDLQETLDQALGPGMAVVGVAVRLAPGSHVPAKLESPKLSKRAQAEIQREIERERRSGGGYTQLDVYDPPAHPPFRITGITAEILLPDSADARQVRYARNLAKDGLWGDPRHNQVIIKRVRFPGPTEP